MKDTPLTITGPSGSVLDRRELRNAPAPVPQSVTPMDLLRIATSQGADLEKLEKLMDLQARWEATEARKAYAEAMAAFKADPPDILKNKHVNRGSAGTFDQATHDEVSGKVAEALSRHGLFHTWSFREEGKTVYVTCRLTHRQGHFEEFTMAGPPDTSGNKSPLQAIASTQTFLQRYTLLGITGLSSREMRAADRVDDDAGAAPTEPAPEGFEAWFADMAALSESDPGELSAAWSRSAPAFRKYVIKFREAEWNAIKAKA